MRTLSKVKAHYELQEALIQGKCTVDNCTEYYLKNILQLTKGEIRMIKIKRIRKIWD